MTVEEPTEEEALEILKGLRPYYEKHHGVVIEDSALEALAVKMSVRYINDRFLPDKAIDIIDEAASKVQIGGYKGASGTEALEEEIRAALREKEEAVRTGDIALAKEARRDRTRRRTDWRNIRSVNRGEAGECPLRLLRHP